MNGSGPGREDAGVPVAVQGGVPRVGQGAGLWIIKGLSGALGVC